ncbi:MAG: alpha/beta fold hydrolase, partial [Acidiferrobacterales bacterium]
GPRPDERPTLVFLHEGLGCLGMWGNFPARVASDTNCGALVYSRSGYGDSTPLERPRTPRYLHQEALHVLPEVLHTMGIERSVLIGHSDGASIALIYAGGTPAPATCALVLEAPHVFVEDITIEGVREAGGLYRSTDLSQKLARYHGDQTNAVFWSWYDTWLSAEFRDWNIEEYLSRINRPMLLIQGEDDEYGTQRQVEAIRSQVAAPAQLIMLPTCGHTPHHNQHEVTLTTMVGFIGSLVG